jgi:hypothetical protein
LNDYQENEYFLASLKNKHLTIAFNNLTISSNKRAINARKVLRSMINFDRSDKNEYIENSLSEKFKKNLDLISSSNNSFDIVLLNEMTIHEDKKTIARITAMMNKYQNVWKNTSETVNVSEKRWIKIKIILETNLEACRIYKIETKNQTIIDKEFDALHILRKMKWAFKFISYAYSMFVM